MISTLLRGIKDLLDRKLFADCLQLSSCSWTWSYHLFLPEPANNQHMVLTFDPLWPIWISSLAPKGKSFAVFLKFLLLWVEVPELLCSGELILEMPPHHPCGLGGSWSCWGVRVILVWITIFKKALGKGAGPGCSYLHTHQEVWIQGGNNALEGHFRSD